jgi:hypothetical protein
MFSSYLNVRGDSVDGVKKGLARRHGDRGGEIDSRFCSALCLSTIASYPEHSQTKSW